MINNFLYSKDATKDSNKGCCMLCKCEAESMTHISINSPNFTTDTDKTVTLQQTVNWKQN